MSDAICSTVLLSVAFMEDIKKQLSETAEVIKHLQKNVIEMHQINSELLRKNTLMKIAKKRLIREKQRRLKPRPILAFLRKLQMVLKFQREQVKSLGKAAMKKEKFAKKLWNSTTNTSRIKNITR